jgi:hypothetical protein
MGICRDKATTYLARFGYNVVRHPRIGVRPLMLVGRQRRSTELLGSLEPDQVAAGISGQETSKLDAAIGVHVLGNILGAMGVPAVASHTRARPSTPALARRRPSPVQASA